VALYPLNVESIFCRPTPILSCREPLGPSCACVLREIFDRGRMSLRCHQRYLRYEGLMLIPYVFFSDSFHFFFI